MGNMDVDTVAQIERLALHAWPALSVEEADGWIMRHAAGVTRRANSVWPNEIRGDELISVRVEKVEAYYHARNLPARFQLSPASLPSNLDEWLSQRGYRATARTAVQTTPIKRMLEPENGNPHLTINILDKPSAQWWECYAFGDGVSEESLAVRKKICDAIDVATAYVLVLRDGEAIAVGSAAVEAGWIGFFNVATVREHRRMGAARTLMQALAQWGVEQGAVMAYLQVMADNNAALNLYAAMGFETGYYYYYREE